MKNNYTREEIIDILVIVFMFSNGNNNQGTSLIKGRTFGDMAETVLNASDSILNTDKSRLSIIPLLRD